MATLATISDRLLEAASTVEAANGREAAKLRAFPNEDIYFDTYLKHKNVDNSRVVRQADPQALGFCWRAIMSACVVVLLLTGLLLPSAYGMIAGYQLEQLKAEQKRLAAESAALDAEVSRLLSPENLQRLANQQQFVEPAAVDVVHLNPATGAQYARAGK